MTNCLLPVCWKLSSVRVGPGAQGPGVPPQAYNYLQTLSQAIKLPNSNQSGFVSRFSV